MNLIDSPGPTWPVRNDDNDNPPWVMAGDSSVDFSVLAVELGAEISGPLTAALERVLALTAHGRIDRPGLADLRREIEAARRAGMMAQQIGRMAGRKLKQNPELLSLNQLVRDALLQRGRETAPRQLDLGQSLQPAQVMADGSLMFTLLQSLVDWAYGHAASQLEFRVELKARDGNARLLCRFDHGMDEVDSLQKLDTLSWRLVQLMTASMGLVLQRADSARQTRVAIEFSQTVHDRMDGVSAIELDHGFDHSLNSKPLAGSHVLVVAARREVRALVRDALRPMGLMVDYTTSVDEAREFCKGGLPHAIIFESGLGGDRFQALARELQAEVPALAFVAIGEDGMHLRSSGRNGQSITRVGREAIGTSLPSALLFELSRGIEA